MNDKIFIILKVLLLFCVCEWVYVKGLKAYDKADKNIKYFNSFFYNWKVALCICVVLSINTIKQINLGIVTCSGGLNMFISPRKDKLIEILFGEIVTLDLLTTHNSTCYHDVIALLFWPYLCTIKLATPSICWRE